MTPEEYKRIKEAEKEHLLALKKLRKQLKEVERQKTIARAVKDVEDAPGEDLLETHEEMVRRLAMDAIQQEARLEVAMSSAQDEPEPETEEGVEQPEADQAELEKIRAQALIHQMKIQMGLKEPDRKQEPVPNVTDSEHSDDRAEAQDSEGNADNPTRPGELPEKTIGRMPKGPS